MINTPNPGNKIRTSEAATTIRNSNKNDEITFSVFFFGKSNSAQSISDPFPYWFCCCDNTTQMKTKTSKKKKTARIIKMKRYKNERVNANGTMQYNMMEMKKDL